MTRPPIAPPVAMATGPWLITADGAAAVRAAFAAPALAMDDYEDDDEPGKAQLPYELVDGVARVCISGPLLNTGGFWSWLLGGTTYSAIAEAVRAADADAAVQTIVLDVDSPGGEVNGVQGAANAITGASKPLFAFVGGSCCSAAYWLASGADAIVASPTAVIGSIGVYGRLPDERSDAETWDKTRIRTIIASQSPRKLADFDADGGMADVQQQVDDLCDVFVATVAAGRGITPAEVIERYGQGAAFVAARALTAGLIDEVADAADTWLSVGKFSQTEGTTPGDARALTEEAPMGIQQIPAAATSPGMVPVADAAGAKEKTSALRESLMGNLKLLDEIDAELGDTGDGTAEDAPAATEDKPAAKVAGIVARIGALKAKASQADALAERVAALEADAKAKAEAARVKERDAMIDAAHKDGKFSAADRKAWAERADRIGNAEVRAILAGIPKGAVRATSPAGRITVASSEPVFRTVAEVRAAARVIADEQKTTMEAAYDLICAEHPDAIGLIYGGAGGAA